MNSRMLELYKHSQVPNIFIDPSNNMPVESTVFSAEKFAELIVNECADECLRFGDSGDGVTCASAITKHFKNY